MSPDGSFTYTSNTYLENPSRVYQITYVLAQKTFKDSVIGGKVQKNTGQLPQVLVQNNHPAIISRELYYEVQEEMKRRTTIKSPSAKSSTGRSCYSSKYALSERLVCGECGTLYRRCTWTNRGKKKIVWRCVSRLDHGTKYCKESPSMEETALQRAIIEAINSSMDDHFDMYHECTDRHQQIIITMHLLGRYSVWCDLFPEMFNEERLAVDFFLTPWMYHLFSFMRQHETLDAIYGDFPAMRMVLRENWENI